MPRRRSQPHGRTLHLLEVGVPWPPEAFLARKFEGLAAAGFRVTVAANTVRDDRFALSGVELLRVRGSGSLRDGVTLAVRSPARLARLVRNVWNVPPALRRRHGSRARLLSMFLPLARLRPDVVQFEWNIAAVDHLPLFDVWGCPIVTSCRGKDVTVYPHVPNLNAYAEYLPEVMRAAKLVHCASESLAREAVALGLDPPKVRLIRPGVDPEIFRPRPSDEGERVGHWREDFLHVLTVGEVRWEKGYEYALQAIRSLLDHGVPIELTLIGALPEDGRAPSPEQQRVRHNVIDLGLERHVRLLRRAGTNEVPVRLSEADVLMHASLAEGIPNVVLEAMACAVPVVTTNCGGVPEAVTNGVEGYVVATREPDQLARALEALWWSPRLRQTMGEAGRRKVRSAFTLAAQLQAFESMYRGLVA